ncbi:MAG TPA: hypothetical protein VGI58_04680 [Streptosporangiaceae bacterium]
MTNNLSFPELKAQAVALRRASKSIREIKQILGITSNRAIGDALRGEPPPAWTRRPRAKDDLHEKARELRARGWTYAEITAKLGVSKGSVSLWVRDMPGVGRSSYPEQVRSAANARTTYHAAESLRREARRQAISNGAAREIGLLTGRELLIAGAIAYWCEGAKNKPYRNDNSVAFINSDPKMILFFLKFLTAAGVTSDRITCRLSIHERADVAAAEQFWRDVTGLPADQFRRPTLKRHNPKTIRKNTGGEYHGCLMVRVLAATDLYRQIEGWASAVMAA